MTRASKRAPAPSPCPFCSSKDARLLASWIAKLWVVQCHDCFASSRHCETKAEAVEAWNRRPASQVRAS